MSVLSTYTTGGAQLSVPVSARYWAVQEIMNYDASTAAALSGFEMRPSIGGARLIPAAFQASSENGAGEAIGNAVNNDNLATNWSAKVAGGTENRSFVFFDLGAGNENTVAEIMLRARGDGFLQTTPQSFILSYSNNGTVWYNLGSVIDTSPMPAATNEVRTYDVRPLTKAL